MVKTGIKIKTNNDGYIRISTPTITGMNLSKMDKDDKSQMGMITFLSNLGKFVDKFNEEWGKLHEKADGPDTGL